MDGDVEKVDGDVSSGYVFKTTTLSPNVKIQVILRIWMGMLKRVMLVVDMVLWTAILIKNRLVWNHWWMIIIGMIHIWMLLYIMKILVVELVY